MNLRTLFVLVIFFHFCGIVNRVSARAADIPPDTLRLEKPSHETNDSIEYEVIIFDPMFDSWFLANSTPMSFYSKAYLESWNRILVDQWNIMIMEGGSRSCLPRTYLFYDTRVDYGMEVNYTLFYYFKFKHETCRRFSQSPGVWR